MSTPVAAHRSFSLPFCTGLAFNSARATPDPTNDLTNEQITLPVRVDLLTQSSVIFVSTGQARHIGQSVPANGRLFVLTMLAFEHRSAHVSVKSDITDKRRSSAFRMKCICCILSSVMSVPHTSARLKRPSLGQHENCRRKVIGRVRTASTPSAVPVVQRSRYLLDTYMLLKVSCD